MKLKNIMMLGIFALSTHAKVDFKVMGFGGVAYQTAIEGGSVIGITGGVSASKSERAFTVPGMTKTTTTASSTNYRSINLSASANEGRARFFGAILGEFNKEESKKHIAIVVGAFLTNVAPKQVGLDFGIGKNATAKTDTGSFKFKQRGVMLMAGPQTSFHVKKIKIGAGFGLTAASYKAKFTDDSAAPDNTDYALQSSSYSTYGMMPFIKLSHMFGAGELSFFLGHNFSSRPKLKNLKSQAVVDGLDNNPALSVMSQALYRAGNREDGVEFKTRTTYFGVGIAIKSL